MGNLSDRNANLTFVPQVQAPDKSGFQQSAADNTVPTGWLEMNGQAVSRTTYAELFAKIGTTYGVGDGSTTFNLPEGQVYNAVLVSASNFASLTDNGRLAVGGAGPNGIEFHEDSAGTAGMELMYRNGDNTLNIETNGTRHFTCDSDNGYVGIQNTTPSARFHVRRDTGGTVPTLATYQEEGVVIQANNDAGDTAALMILGSNTGQSRIDFGDDNSASRGSITYEHNSSPEGIRFGLPSENNTLFLATSGAVGIGTNDPGAIGSRLAVSEDTNNQIVVQIEQTGGTIGGTVLMDMEFPGAANPSNSFIRFRDNGGNVGSISGDGAGNVTYNTTSDARLKTDIEDLSNCLHTIMRMRPRSFTWKSSGKRAQGFIAQELGDAYPQAVVKPQLPDDHYAVSLPVLVTPLVGAVQELSVRQDALEARLEALEAKLSGN